MTSSPKPDASLTALEVEYYAGGRGEEFPLAVVRDGRRLLVTEVRERKRTLVPATGARREVFICLLENGEVVTVERDL